MIRSRVQERVKLQGLHDTSQINADNLNTAICVTNRHFGKKKFEVSLKGILNNENRNIRT
jgi:tRNA A37 threonylcarbamoyladenosine dehydratase